MDVLLGRDLTLVTNNARDFVPLYRDLELHAGLVLILPNVARPQQIALFDRALDVIEMRRDLVNMVVEVGQDGGLAIRPFPA